MRNQKHFLLKTQDSVAPNPLDKLSGQNWIGKLILLLSALNLNISFSLTNKKLLLTL